MTRQFDPSQGLIVVDAVVEGPGAKVAVSLALDTGATSTFISVDMLVDAGYDPAALTDQEHVTTGSGYANAPRLPITSLTALGQRRTSFSVLAHTLPPGLGIDGLLGLDFIRGLTLTIDFRGGQITLV